MFRAKANFHAKLNYGAGAMAQRQVFRLIGALALSVAVLFSPAVLAQAPGADLQTLPANALPVSPSRPPDPEWRVQCDTRGETKRCAVLMSIFFAETGQLNLSLRIDKGPEGGLRLQVRLPTDLFLPAGLSFQVDDHPAGTMGFLTCSAAACLSGGPLSDDVLTDMKAGGTLNLSYETAGRKTVSEPVTLIGFTAAIDQL
jgi:invasion protein IalB